MSPERPRRTLESFKKEAKRWLDSLRAGEPEARARLTRTLPGASVSPSLRDVQLALAREHGFDGWTALKAAVEAAPESGARPLEHYESSAVALLEAYRTGTPEAMERHYRLTWHRRAWPAMRTYVQLDLGKRPAHPGDDVDITMDDARYLVAREHGFESWNALSAWLDGQPPGTTMTSKPMRLLRPGTPGNAPIATSRAWEQLLEALKPLAGVGLDAAGEMTDAMLHDLAGIEQNDRIVGLNLSASRALTDDGLRHLARLPNLRHLNLGSTDVTDRGLAVLAELPKLEAISLVMTRVTDAGMSHLARCEGLTTVQLQWTATGDGAIRAMAGKPRLNHFRSGNGVTDVGLAALHDLPVFKTWQGGDAALSMLSPESGPNHLVLRGPFTDAGMQQLRGLDGLFGLNLDDARLSITAAAMSPLAALPHLGWLSVDAKDDWMPHLAALPALRYLGIQDTSAGDDGFVALAKSKTIEHIWGRRCHNLRQRGFLALSHMPALRGLSVSCLNVDDEAIAALPSFPALRELMPMDIPDAGYRHIGRCGALESLILMYCRNTTDAATEHITSLDRLSYYFNSYTTITDRTPELLSRMDSLERITFDGCHGLTDAGVATLARLPKLRELRISGRGLTSAVAKPFPASVSVYPES